MPDIRNVYMFSHVSGEDFYSRKRQEKVLMLIEFDDCFLLHRRKEMDDDPQVIDITDDNSSREKRLNTVLTLVDLYLTHPEMR